MRRFRQVLGRGGCKKYQNKCLRIRLKQGDIFFIFSLPDWSTTNYCNFIARYLYNLSRLGLDQIANISLLDSLQHVEVQILYENSSNFSLQELKIVTIVFAASNISGVGGIANLYSCEQMMVLLSGTKVDVESSGGQYSTTIGQNKQDILLIGC